jgi:hypothetical protein
MSPFESAITLPCSLESSSASESISRSTSALNANITRARRCGLVAAHAGCARSAACTAASTSAAVPSGTRACTTPREGSNTSAQRPSGVPETAAPSMK